MSRTRAWMKVASFGGLAVVLGAALLSLADLPRSGLAQQRPTVLSSAPALETSAAPVRPAQPVVDLGNSFVEVAAAVKPAVVYIQAETRAQERDTPGGESPFERFFGFPPNEQQRPRMGSGSGFILSADGYIMTNNHVVEGFDRLDVTLPDKRQFKARVIGTDPNTDVAVIKIDATGLTAVSLGDSDDLQVGEWVLAIGNPLGLQFTVTAGIVSARGRPLNDLLGSEWSIADFIQTDAAINPGNSGGPLVNVNGQVVGINSAIASRTGTYVGYGFAIPMNLARTIGDQLIRDGKVTRAALQVQIRPVTPEDAEYVGLEEIRGVVLQGFSNDDSPAKAAGMLPGDVIIEVDGRLVDYIAQLQQLVGFRRPGERVPITVMRAGGERKTFNVRLAEAATTPDQTRVASARPEHEDASTAGQKLGIAVEPLNDRWAARFTDDATGVVVTDVDPDGPSRGRLFPVDQASGMLTLITHVEGTRVKTPADLNEALKSVRAGSVVSLRVVRAAPDQTGRLVTLPGVVRVRVN
ncbi:MAG TPA: trypsin-like peptidase domain-containing protein [Gemmatimonadales bacterium]